MTRVVSDRELVYAERGSVWKVETLGVSIAAAASYKLGFTTPNVEVVVLTRDYSSTVAAILASLHTRAYSGGTLARNLNLRLNYSGAVLMDIYESVTSSASLGDIITSASIRAGVSTGNANASLPGDLKPVILAPLTPYIVNMRNDGGAAGDIGLSFYYRARVPLPTFNEAP